MSSGHEACVKSSQWHSSPHILCIMKFRGDLERLDVRATYGINVATDTQHEMMSRGQRDRGEASGADAGIVRHAEEYG